MKKAHIISHSHWDREWYLPYEKHHMLLIEFFDTLIDTLEKDNDYKSFHLDGQTLLIEDYLQVRPENKARLKKLIETKRIYVGPWFILQDEFLTSSEANVRNLQIGHQLAKQYGNICKVGYFPDSFGNMGQAPQMLKKAGIDTAVFGRGVKPTGFNNQVSESDTYESPYSEMYWQSEDGSSVLGILFANWYSNGIHIPTDENQAKQYWAKKIEDAEKFASTSHLLFMNGCDHQPVQTNLSDAIKTAKKVYPNVDFIHSNFEDYIKCVKSELKDDLSTITGELRSQQTDGWYTLANTASSRIYIKQANAKCQMLFEKVAEPLAVMAYKQGKDYPHHLFNYGYKLLMENHPHDSICGCSVDDVHREMVVRFEKAENVAKYIIDESLDYLKNKVDTTCFEKDAIPFVVVNTSADNRSGVVEINVEVAKKYFKEDTVPNIVKQMHLLQLPTYKVVNAKGEEVNSKVEVIPNYFNYDLPKDKFRDPYIAKRVKVTLEIKDIKSFSFETFALIPNCENKCNKQSMVKENNKVDTPFYEVEFNKDGSFNVLNKKDGKIWQNLGVFEDCGDIGNEYIYFMPIDEKPITTKGVDAKIEIIEDEDYRVIVKVTHTMKVPKKANETLDEEIQDLVEFKDRKAQRVSDLTEQIITVKYIFEKSNPVIKAICNFNNQALDHRIRVLFETNLDTKHHFADSIFEVAKRDNIPDKAWENPCNAQHQQAFVNLHTNKYGLTIANKGLNEYEILRDGKNTIAITIHRGIRELGDWGVFLTPEAQCLGERQVEFAIIPHSEGKDVYKSYKLAYQYQIDWAFAQTKVQKGTIQSGYQILDTNHLEVAHSALKLSLDNKYIVTRWFNLTTKDADLTINTLENIVELDLLEEKEVKKLCNNIKLGKKEIITIGLKK